MAMNGHDRDGESTANVAAHTQRTDDLEDDLTHVVERSYAKRLVTAPDLSRDEKKRIREKQAASRPSSDQFNDDTD
jgi:hypothetical protein